MASLDLTVDITNAQILAVGMGRATRPLACATARHVLDALSYGAGQIAARKLAKMIAITMDAAIWATANLPASVMPVFQASGANLKRASTIATSKGCAAKVFAIAIPDITVHPATPPLLLQEKRGLVSNPSPMCAQMPASITSVLM